MNLESYIKTQAAALKGSRRDIDIAPDIPQELMEKWLHRYRNEIGAELQNYILVMSSTMTGSLVLTGDAIYYDNYIEGGLQRLGYTEIEDAACRHGSAFGSDQIHIRTRSGRSVLLSGSIDGLNLENLTSLLCCIARRAEGSVLTISNQLVNPCDFSEEIKALYLQILCNYAYLDNSAIDLCEYNAITQFSVRMEAQAFARKQLRAYINSIDSRIKTGVLLRDLKNKISPEQGQWDTLRYSLLQDVLYIHRLRSPSESWKQDGFIGSLMKACKLNPSQLNTMETAVTLNQKMQEKDCNLKKLKTEWLTFLSSVRYTPGYVPAACLFCSGSVYGYSSFRSFLRNSELSEKSVSKQRELILHEIITNNQKTINVMIEDMNYVAQKLEQAMQEGAELQLKYQNIIRRIQNAMSSIHPSDSPNGQSSND